jgi:hypothetical protein
MVQKLSFWYKVKNLFHFIILKLFFLRSGHNHCKNDEEVPVVGVGITGSGVGVQFNSVGIGDVKDDDSEMSTVSLDHGRHNNLSRAAKGISKNIAVADGDEHRWSSVMVVVMVDTRIV